MAAKKDTYITTFKAEGTDQFERQAKRAQHSVRNMAKETGELKKQLRFMRGGLGQVGHQVQDIAVQLQAGTNGLIVFGQQGSQIASLFGAQGAVIGAILAVGAAIGTALLPQLFKTVDHADEIEKAFAKIDRSFKRTKDGTIELTDELRTLGQVGIDVATVQLQSAMIEAENAMNKSIGGILASLGELDDVGVGLSGIDDFVDTMVMLDGVATPQMLSKAYIETAKELGQQFGIAGKEAFQLGDNLLRMIGQVKLDPTIENFKALQLELSNLAKSEDISKATKSFVSSLNDYFLSALKAENKTAALKKVLSDLSGELEKEPDGKSVDLQAQEDFIASLNRQIELYGASNVELAVAEASQLGIKGAQLEQVAIAAENLELLKQQTAEQAQQKALAEQKKRDAQILAEKQQSFTDKIQQEVDLYGASQRALTLNKAVQMGITGEKLGRIALLTLELEKLNEITQAEQNRQSIVKQGNQMRLDALLTENEQMALNYQRELEFMRFAGATNDELMARKDQQRQEFAEKQFQDNELLVASMQTFQQAATTALTKVIKEGASLGDVMRSVGDIVVTSLINTFAQMATQYIASKLSMMLFDNTLQTANMAKDKIAATTLAASYAPAAAAVSLATQGGNAIPAAAGMKSTFALSQMLSLASFDGGGFTGAGARSGGMDGRGGFLAMLHPNETVLDHTKGQGSANVSNNIIVNVNGGDDGFRDPISTRQIEAGVYKGASKAYRRNR